jgi:Transcriptional Coactivator p15 (PC4)
MNSNDLRGRAQQHRNRQPQHVKATQPPEERGTRLAACGRGQGEELRISCDEYEGRHYVSLRIWTQDIQGGWWPSNKGVTIRLRDLPAVADALATAMDLAEQDQRSQPLKAGQGGRTGGGQRRDWKQADLPSSDGREGFDEFKDDEG